MEHLSKAELQWLAEAVKMTGQYYDNNSRRASNQVERGLSHLRYGQLTIIGEKLKNALEHGDKRIAIN